MAEDLRNAEAIPETDEDKIRAVFAARSLYRRALERKNRAENDATLEAPVGFLYRITAMTNKSLTVVHDIHKPNRWYQDLEAGRIVFAPRIDSARQDGYSTSTMTSWVRGPSGYPFSLDNHEPVRINNAEVNIDLITVKEFVERRLASDMTLFGPTYSEAPSSH